MASGDSHLAIIGVGLISSIGVGMEEFTESFWEKRSGKRHINNTEQGAFPFGRAHTIPEFSVHHFLGKKGTRGMDRTGGMVTVATKMAIEMHNITEDLERLTAGIVLGTSTGSTQSHVDFIRETLVQESPDWIDPLLFPKTVMNCAAGQSAIWHRLYGVNATIAGGYLSGFFAFRYAASKIRLGYADLLLVGCVEEFNPYSAWIYYHSVSSRCKGTVSFGEGCTMFAVEEVQAARARRRKIYAELIACEVDSSLKNAEPKRRIDCLRGRIDRMLENAKVSPEQICAVSRHRNGDPEIDHINNRALERVFDRASNIYNVTISELTGDCISASMGFQLSALLALFRRIPCEDNQYALITTVTQNGPIGCALIKRGTE